MATNKIMMRLFFHTAIVLSFLISQVTYGQDYFQNLGNLKIFDDANVLVGLDLVNDGIFTNNQGTLVMRSNESQVISGLNSIELAELVIDNQNDVWVENQIDITSQLAFINGNVITLKSESEHFVSFASNALASNADDLKKVDGYAVALNKQNFLFPVGNAISIRPLLFSADEVLQKVTCAYFDESPNASIYFSDAFDTNAKEGELEAISSVEFWWLDAQNTMTLTLTWVEGSNIQAIADSTDELIIVGWHKELKQWMSLGRQEVNGSLSEGFLTSNAFQAAEFSALTFGSISTFQDFVTDNYFISPNGDGTNETLHFEGIENFPYNVLQIYNRYGVKVYQKERYSNEFSGITNRSTVIARPEGLSSGVYYYILHLDDEGNKRNGFFYLSDK